MNQFLEMQDPLVRNEKVRGSTPLGSTTSDFLGKTHFLPCLLALEYALFLPAGVDCVRVPAPL